MAVLSTARSRAGIQAHERMQQLYTNAEHMRLAADAAWAQYGEASYEYSVALDRWNEALQYLGMFIHELVAASANQMGSSCQDLAHRSR